MRYLTALLVIVVATPLAWAWAHYGGWGSREESLVLLEGGLAAAFVVVWAVLRMTGTGRARFVSDATESGWVLETDERRIEWGHDMRTGHCACGAWHKDGV